MTHDRLGYFASRAILNTHNNDDDENLKCEYARRDSEGYFANIFLEWRRFASWHVVSRVEWHGVVSACTSVRTPTLHHQFSERLTLVGSISGSPRVRGIWRENCSSLGRSK